MNPIELPDLQAICKTQIPSLRYVPVKFRLSWLKVFTRTIEGCVSEPNSTENRKKPFAISKCILRASYRGGKKHTQNHENLVSKSLSAGKLVNTLNFGMKLHRSSNQEQPLMIQ